MAGITGAVIVLPQGVAFAIIAGLPPIYGLYTAMITPIIAGLFGSSRHLISGPTTAISLVVFSGISAMAAPGTLPYVELVLALTLFAGVIQLGLGLARLGALVNFVSHTVVVGFTTGAAILIATSQIRHVVGLNLPSGHSFVHTWQQLFYQWSYIHTESVLIAGFTLLVALLSQRFLPGKPHLLIALIAGSGLGALFGGAEAGIDVVGEMPAALPSLTWVGFNLETFRELAPTALAVALLGLIEAVAIGRSIAINSGQRIDPNQEFIGQGLSNVVGSFFGCYAGSGSFTRSGVNYEAGARTPMSAVFAALILMVIVLLVAPWGRYLPMPAMGGIILLVAYRLVDFHHIQGIWSTSKRETSTLLATFLATLLLDLEFAIYAGVIFSLMFYLHRTSHPNVAVMAPDPDAPNRRFTNLLRKTELLECPQLKVIRIDGSLFYGSIDHVATALETMAPDPGQHLLLQAEGINFVDLAGAEWLVQEALNRRDNGADLYLSGLKQISQDVLLKGGYKSLIGNDNFFQSKSTAIAAIFQRMGKVECAQCHARIFEECGGIQEE